MATLVATMTKDELREMIGTLIEQKLIYLIGDLDEGLSIKKFLYNRLIRQKKAVSKGETGESFDDIVKRLGLE